MHKLLRNLATLSPHSAMGKLVRWPLHLIPGSHVATVRGGLNRGAKWVVGTHTHGCWLGIYEPETQAMVARLIRPEMVVWDVGANAGFYTLAFSRLVGPAGKVYAFEPVGENVGHLLRHVQINDRQNVDIVQAALGDYTGLASFQMGKSLAMGRLTTQATAYHVPVFTPDDFLARIPGARPDVIKLDVEGAEGAFLAGAASVLRQPALSILLSLHGEDAARACHAILAANGFTFFQMDGTPLREWTFRESEVVAQKGALLPAAKA